MSKADINLTTKLPRAPLSVDEVGLIIKRRLGLIIGPGATIGPIPTKEIADHITGGIAFDLNGSAEVSSMDDLVRAGVPLPTLRSQIRTVIRARRPSPELEALGKCRWAGVLSASIDPFFDDAFQQWASESPARPAVTIVTDLPNSLVPPRSIPVYKLLGSIHREDFVVSSNDYRVRRTVWSRALREFATVVQGGPVLCVGMVEAANVLFDVLAEMLADPQRQPGPLLFLQGDPVAGDGTLDDLAVRGLTVHHVGCDIGSFLKIYRARLTQAFTPELPFHGTVQSAFDRLASFDDLAVVVNSQRTSSIGAGEVHLLRDLLFSPTAPRWDPFVRGLDFGRTVTASVIQEVKTLLTTKYWSEHEVVISGPSATGKTTVLKRAALDLATEGTLVLWLKPYFFQNGPTEIRRLFEQVAEARASTDERIVVFVDDPVGLGAVRLSDVRSAIRAAHVEAVIVLGVRTTDVATSDTELEADAEVATADIVVPDKFDDAEWKGLPEYLVKLGVASKLDEAKADVTNSPSRITRDVLGMLYWLLPETRKRITDSVREEFFRLGDRSAFRNIVLGEFKHSSDILKDAYGLVAVSAKYGAPVPIEVLVSALRVSYEEWLRAVSPNGLVWGLLYQEVAEESQTTVYRTRNDVVTSIVVEAINSGTMSNSGELVGLKRLLGACNGNSPAYREYCLRVLVPNNRTQLERLEYAEGLELFETAVAALPYEDRTILHHLGRWEKNKGKDTARARKTLERALVAKPYPYSSRGEAAEHIYTTMAANEVDAIRNKQIAPDEGKRNALAFLERARSDQFINSNAVHTQARLIASLADVTGDISDPDSIAMIDVALGDIDRMLLVLNSVFVASDRRKQSIEMLEGVRDEVLDRTVHLGDATANAESLWKAYARQDGFVLVGRKLYGIAQSSGNGSDFLRAFEYCSNSAERVLNASVPLSHQLAEVLLHIYFRWRIRRRVMSPSTDPIDWQYLEGIASAVAGNSRNHADPFYSYVLALTKAHLGDWPGATAIFDELRNRPLPNEVIWEPRDFLMNQNGGMAKVQGVVKQGAGKNFLHVESLATDFLMDRDGRWARPGEINHAYVRFRFAGPLAVEEP
jgi:hypothetical protein